MEGFDPSALLSSLVWLRPELLLTLAGFVVLGISVLLREGAGRVAGIVSAVAIVAATVLVVSYVPGSPVGPTISAGEVEGAFPDGDGNPAFVTDGFSLVFKLVFLAGALLTVLMSFRYLELVGARAGEFYAILLFAVLGMMFLASGNDFATIYIGLETMAISSYVLVGFTKANRKSNEAALKYFLLGAFASGILLFGISLVFGTTGSFNLDGIAAAIAAGARGPYTLLQIGAVLVLVGLGFKIAAVPFHMWTPDAYEGAPTPVAAFLSTASKAAAFAVLLRIFLQGFYGLAGDWTPLLVILAVASMTIGNVVAIVQDNVKRMLAYSSIAHAGYMLMGLIAMGSSGSDALTLRHGMTAVVLYAIVYTFTNIGAFGLVAVLRRREQVGDRVEDFRGLAKTNPMIAAAMVVFLLSLAGIPCTSGFIGKWWLFGAAIRADYAWLAVVAVINTAISLYYYVRVVVAMYMAPPVRDERVRLAPGLAAVLAVAVVVTLGIGLYPQPVIDLAQFAFLPLPQ